MKFYVRIEEKKIGCGAPGCSEGCGEGPALEFHLHATSEEDLQRFVADYMRGMDRTDLISSWFETSVEDPEISVMLTPSFESQQWKDTYEDAVADMNKAREELHVLIKYGAARDILNTAMDKFQLAVEYCAFLRGG